MSSVETGQLSAVETGQMSAAEKGQMSVVETRQMSSVARSDICLVSTHNVEVSDKSKARPSPNPGSAKFHLGPKSIEIGPNG